jgi:hypothetical protein
MLSIDTCWDVTHKGRISGGGTPFVYYTHPLHAALPTITPGQAQSMVSGFYDGKTIVAGGDYTSTLNNSYELYIAQPVVVIDGQTKVGGVNGGIQIYPSGGVGYAIGTAWRSYDGKPAGAWLGPGRPTIPHYKVGSRAYDSVAGIEYSGSAIGSFLCSYASGNTISLNAGLTTVPQVKDGDIVEILGHNSGTGQYQLFTTYIINVTDAGDHYTAACTLNAPLPVGYDFTGTSVFLVSANDYTNARISRWSSSQGQTLISSRAAALSAPGLPQTFTVAGFSTPGDLGSDAVYTSQGATSTGPMAFQNNGVWYQLVLHGRAKVGWWGLPTGTDDTVNVQKAFDDFSAAGGGILEFDGSTVYYSNQFMARPKVSLEGNNAVIRLWVNSSSSIYIMPIYDHEVIITAGLVAGDNKIPVTDTTGYNIGDLAYYIMAPDDASMNYDSGFVVITGVAGVAPGTLTVDVAFKKNSPIGVATDHQTQLQHSIRRIPNPIQNVVYRNFKFDTAASDTNPGAHMYFYYCRNIKIDNIVDIDGGVGTILTTSCENFDLDNIYIDRSILTPSGYAGPRGLNFSDHRNIRINNFHAKNMTGAAIYTDYESTIRATNVHVRLNQTSKSPFYVGVGARLDMESVTIEGMGGIDLYSGTLGDTTPGGPYEGTSISFRDLTVDLSSAPSFPSSPGAVMKGLVRWRINGVETVYDLDQPKKCYYNTRGYTGNTVLDANADMYLGDGNNFTGNRASEVVLYLPGVITAGFTLQLPLATAFIAQALAGNQGGFVPPGYAYKLRVINAGGTGLGIWTVIANTGWNLVGTMTIGPSTYRDFYITLTSPTTLDITNVGSGSI